MSEDSATVEAIEALRNTELKLKVNVDGKVGVDVKNIYRSEFPNLPTEIRSKIWEVAMPGPRIVEIGLHEEDNWMSDNETVPGSTNNLSTERVQSLPYLDLTRRDWRRSMLTPNPVTLFINHESRRLTLRRYKVMCSSPEGYNQCFKDKPDSIIYMDPVNDVPYFSTCSSCNPTSTANILRALEVFLPVHAVSRPEQAKLINTIAIPAPHSGDVTATLKLTFAIFRISSLVKIILVMNSPNEGQVRTSLKPYRYLSWADAANNDAAGWERSRKDLEDTLSMLLSAMDEETSVNSNVHLSGNHSRSEASSRRRVLAIEAKVVVSSDP